MDQSKIDYIKRAIKRAYKQYTGERTDGNATLVDVAKFFNIPIDESRLADYELKAINYNDELSMDLIDRKNDIEYNSKYTYSYRQNKLRYINVIATNPFKKIENVYYIGDNDPIITKITFIDGEYKLTFEKERPNDAGVFNVNANTKFTIRYLVDHYDKYEEETYLLFKTFQKHDDGQSVYDFEQTQTNAHVANKENLDSQSKHTFTESDNVMFGVDSFQRSKGNHNSVRGAFFESTRIDYVERHFPSSLDLYHPSNKFYDAGTLSAIILMGNTDDTSDMEIYKTNDGIDIYYKFNKFLKDKMKDMEFHIPNLDAGMITSREIKYLLENLKILIGDRFIDLISNDLLEFAKKIDIRKGIEQEELDPLSPKLFFDKNIEEVERMVESDKDRYFQLASEQYSAISNRGLEKGQTKVLKSTNL